MINFDDVTNENEVEHNSNWPYIPDHPYRILIIGRSGSGKTNALVNLIKQMHLLNTQMICKMSVKILRNTISERNVNY